jgi:hypothetical protein
MHKKMGENSVRCCYSCQHTSTRTICTLTHTYHMPAMRVRPYQRKNRLVVPSPQLPELRTGRASGVPVHCARKMIVVPYTLESVASFQAVSAAARRAPARGCKHQIGGRGRGGQVVFVVVYVGFAIGCARPCRGRCLAQTNKLY